MNYNPTLQHMNFMKIMLNEKVYHIILFFSSSKAGQIYGFRRLKRVVITLEKIQSTGDKLRKLLKYC